MRLHPSNHVVVRSVVSVTLLLAGVSTGQAEDRGAEPVGLSVIPEASADLRSYTHNPDFAEVHANNVAAFGPWDGPELVNGIPLGSKVIDGDIVVPGDFGEQTAATYATNVWPFGVIPYQFDANVTLANANAMIVAMGWWENVATVDFRPRNGEGDYIHIRANTFNNAGVGRRGGAQIINIVNWNNTGVMAHELGHALGYWHEQSAADRDDYVIINTANVCQNCCQQADGSMGSCNFNFQIESTASAYGDYDFASVMHYGRCFFSTNAAGCNAACPSAVGETLIVKQPYYSQWHCLIGAQAALSYWDSVTMSFMYPRANWRFQSNLLGSDFFPGNFFFSFGTFSRSYNETPVGGTMWILDPSTHVVGPVLNKAITIGAPLGGVILTR